MSVRVVALLLFAAPFLMPAYAGDDVPIDELPAPVRKGIDQRFPGAQLLSAERDRDDGRVEYEVQIRHDAKRYEVELWEDGKIKDIDRED